MQQPNRTYLQMHAMANDKVTPSTFKRGIISAIYPTSGTMDVQLVGNQTTALKGIYFSSAINPNSVKVGDKCRVDFFSEINPNDAVVSYSYGRVMKNTASGIFSYTGTISTSGTLIKIPHTLGSIPTTASVSSPIASEGIPASPAVSTFGIYIGGGPANAPMFDSNYIYVTAQSAGNVANTNLVMQWSVTCL